MLTFASAHTLAERKEADMLVLPFWKGEKHPEPAADVSSLQRGLGFLLSTEDFSGKEGELLVSYVTGLPEKRVCLLGLGAEGAVSVEKLRRSYSEVVKKCRKLKLKTLNVLLPKCPSLAEADVIRGLSEGLLLPNYAFTALKHDSLKEGAPVLLERVVLVGATKSELAIANKCATISDSVNFVRDLVNGNADDVTPQYLTEVAKRLEKGHKRIKTTVFDKRKIEKEKMGLLLAVNRGSFRDPAFLIVDYKGNPRTDDKTVIVGKGITFDTGGLLIKPKGGMETMKDDMAGAAVALGTVRAAAALHMPVNITAVIPTTENSVGPKSYKPGDVYAAYSGKTVEIGDTDAEGRLVLADALAYAVKKLKPSRIVDLATLTGSIIFALGDEASGLMSNHDALAELLVSSGAETGERVWRMPLWEDYKGQLKSDIADIKNVGGRNAGSITAAIFLQEFVGKTPWAHIDIAGTAYLNEVKRYHPKYATGYGVRLLLAFLENLKP